MSTITVNPTHNDVLPADAERVNLESERAVRAEAPVKDVSIGKILKTVMPSTIVAVFFLTVAMVVAAGGPLGEAVGYGAYLAFWIGGGFGAIFSGAYLSYVTDGDLE